MYWMKTAVIKCGWNRNHALDENNSHELDENYGYTIYEQHLRQKMSYQISLKPFTQHKPFLFYLFIIVGKYTSVSTDFLVFEASLCMHGALL